MCDFFPFFLPFFFFLGLTDIKNETYVQESEVREMFLHPKYRPPLLYDYDIAVLMLDRPIEYNPFVRPICLPPIGKIKKIINITMKIFFIELSKCNVHK